MFNLPHDDSPELLVGEFDFQRYHYEVCFEIIEEQCGWFGSRTRTAKRFYITSQRKSEFSKEEIEVLKVYTYRCTSNSYRFMTPPRGSAEVVYWDNPTDPINLLTFLKARLDKGSHKDFVVFSTKDLD